MKCKYCNSENLILEKRSKDNKHILDAQQVALICGDCGKYIKWCPKDERKFYWVKMKMSKNNLEEENRVLKKALELAIQEINRLERDCNLAYIRASECLFDDFIQQAKENTDER